MTKPKNVTQSLASQQIKGMLPKKYHMEYRSGMEELVEEKSLKEVEKMIRKTGENIDVPDSLLPDNISRKLEFLQKRGKKHVK
jgi:hypothetical protein